MATQKTTAAARGELKISASSGKSPKISAILPYFGGKRTMAPDIVRLIGDHSVYWEPFCGSMAVLLAKPVVSAETVNDLHADLVNLARVIQHPTHGAKFYRRLRRTMMCEGLFRDAIEIFKQPFDGTICSERAHAYFLVSWMGRNGIAGTAVGQKRGSGHSFCVRYTSTGGTPGTRWNSVIDSVCHWRERLKNVTILQRDAFEVLAKIEDKDGVVIFADPPYLAQTRSGFAAIGGNSNYLHDFKPADHARLAEALGRFQRSRVILSYYDHPDLDVLYPFWKKIDAGREKAMANSGKAVGTKVSAPEVLLINQNQQPELF